MHQTLEAVGSALGKENDSVESNTISMLNRLLPEGINKYVQEHLTSLFDLENGFKIAIKTTSIGLVIVI